MESPNQASSVLRPPEELYDRQRQLDPFDWYARMRRESPVRYDESRKMWDVFRYEDVDRVLSDYDAFSSDMRDAEAVSFDDDQAMRRTMINAEPPEHDRLRRFVDERFRPGTIRELQPRLEAFAAEFLDAVEDADRIDLVGDFAYPFPVTVIAELLGIPADRRDQFKSWSDALVASPTEETTAAMEKNERQRQRARREMAEYFGDLLDERADGDGDDLITLAATSDDLERDEKVGFCILLLIAGNITTTNLITNAVWCFDEHDVTDAVRTGEIDRKQAIEEVLRYRSPAQSIRRVATRDVELGGETIEAGELVTAWIGSANRDPDVFDAPEEFRPERSPNRHIAFGKGIHYCLGAPLARVEADIALDALLDRFDTIEPTDEPKSPLSTQLLHGLEALPCRVERAE
ncbi:cytochrome P450 [Haladaptatus paucihalophilus DX253]|uniref:Cytochrome P450 n=1 Tax=Haladaptatus paucihalophilus DX253 TaxID=797209 RepID=E7QY69_HALPU|nr:cytochrome P450 [Haladaptatus paucihalophilus]EFW90535.1 cytochrome P450 [Haladaptatus paucihalophilus DX253]SHK77238.1 Cytochrome P450 [Haladaptatus paucihalophilus DX253]